MYKNDIIGLLIVLAFIILIIWSITTQPFYDKVNLVVGENYTIGPIIYNEVINNNWVNEHFTFINNTDDIITMTATTPGNYIAHYRTCALNFTVR
jgi:hypothetical protein